MDIKFFWLIFFLFNKKERRAISATIRYLLSRQESSLPIKLIALEFLYKKIIYNNYERQL